MIILWVLLGVIAAIGIFLAYTLIRYLPIIERNAFDVPRYQVPVDYKFPSDLKVKDLHIAINGSEPFAAKLAPSKNGSAGPMIVFCHETGADADSWLKHGNFLPQRGFDVLSFTMENGTSEYQWPTHHELNRLHHVLDWVRKNRPERQVVLFGISKGASIAMAAAHHPVVKGLILDGVFSTHLTLRYYMKKWVRIYVTHEGFVSRIPDCLYSFLSHAVLWYAGFHKKAKFFSMESFIKKLKKPVLFIHAEKDPFVRLEDINKIRNQIPKEGELWVAEGAAHSGSVTRHPDQYQKRVTDFLKTK